MSISSSGAPFGRGLSARVLAITVGCILIGELLIFLPSLARFWETYLEQRIAAAHLATLELSSRNEPIDQMLADELLIHSGTVAITVLDPTPHLMLGEMPMVDRVYRLKDQNFLDPLLSALETLYQGGTRFIRVISEAPMKMGIQIDIVLADAHLWTEMVAYARRILLISLALSALITALLFVSLQRVIVRPLARIAAQLTEFRRHPEDESGTSLPGLRPDEIGIVERELTLMECDLRQALASKDRLATLGEAVSRINHDLRNSLSSALLVSDRLERSDDPAVRDVTPRLVRALERSIRLCETTLAHARNRPQPLRLAPVNLRELVNDTLADILATRVGLETRIDIDPDLTLLVDHDEMYRVLTNLFRNAAMAMPDGGKLTITARHGSHIQASAHERSGHGVVILVKDSGSGIPPHIIDHLFEPFATADREQGTGLGLANSREIIRRHGGDIRLAATGAEGTSFKIILPERSVG